jgi:hypothetical protein
VYELCLTGMRPSLVTEYASTLESATAIRASGLSAIGRLAGSILRVTKLS